MATKCGQSCQQSEFSPLTESEFLSEMSEIYDEESRLDNLTMHFALSQRGREGGSGDLDRGCLSAEAARAGGRASHHQGQVSTTSFFPKTKAKFGLCNVRERPNANCVK